MARSIDELRSIALKLFQAAIDAADPGAALTRHLSSSPLKRPNGRLILVAVGKAAVPMMRSALAAFGDAKDVTALVVTNYENAAEIQGVEVHLSGHPVPDANGLAASKRVKALLGSADENDQVVALISGGGSALLPAPVPGVSLEDKAEVNRLLLASGFDIEQMNLNEYEQITM